MHMSLLDVRPAKLEPVSEAAVSPRFSRSDVPFVALAVAAGGALLHLGRSLTFWYDDWSFVTFSGSAIDFSAECRLIGCVAGPGMQ